MGNKDGKMQGKVGVGGLGEKKEENEEECRPDMDIKRLPSFVQKRYLRILTAMFTK